MFNIIQKLLVRSVYRGFYTNTNLKLGRTTNGSLKQPTRKCLSVQDVYVCIACILQMQRKCVEEKQTNYQGFFFYYYNL